MKKLVLSLIWFASSPIAANPINPFTFRDIFVGYLDPALQSKADSLIYLPTDEMLHPSFDKSANIYGLTKFFQNFSPETLYKIGADHPAGPIASKSSDAAIKKHPITIIIVPGIFAEFIDTPAFSEVFTATAISESVAAQKFKAALSNHVASTRSLDLTSLKFKDLPLNNFLTVSSIKAEDGSQPLDVILLNTPRLSLESVGGIENRARIFNRRLSQYFKLTGTPENIMFLGYSRGAIVGLEMLTQAKKAPWIKNVRGLVSLGGVVFGSAAADDLDTPESQTAREIQQARILYSSLIEDIAAFTHNNLAYGKFTLEMGLINGVPDITQIFDSVRRADPREIIRLILEMKDALLNNPRVDYALNVKKFKHVLNELLLGVDELKTSQRLKWWATHTVPTNGIRYYSLAATMANKDGSDVEKTMMSGEGYSKPLSIDDEMLEKNYLQFAQMAQGSHLNDSQMAVHQVQFWNNIITQLNPAQAPLQTTFLGVLGTHHWGLALATVNKQRNGQVNPFPRIVLLKALAATLAYDLE